MRIATVSRFLLLTILMCCFALPSFASVYIRVGFAPPIMPTYEQPPCPGPDLIWTPGYWAYSEDGYYWVPGAWVPAPYSGALWTPGYWGWNDGSYVWFPGYWGPHVGYYGGINYGFGYFGIGFVGGEWRGGSFFYNTAVMRVDVHMVHHTWMDRAPMAHAFADRSNRAAFNGGPGGIQHQPLPMERMAARDQHMGGTSFQQQHEMSAHNDRGAWMRNNGGHPQNLAVQRPLSAESHAAPAGGMNRSYGTGGAPQSFNHSNAAPQSNGWNGGQRQSNAQPQYNAQPQQYRGQQSAAQPQQRSQAQSPRPQQQGGGQSAPRSNAAPQGHSDAAPRGGNGGEQHGGHERDHR